MLTTDRLHHAGNGEMAPSYAIHHPQRETGSVLLLTEILAVPQRSTTSFALLGYLQGSQR